MEKSVEVLFGMAVLAVLTLIVGALYRWRQAVRIHRVEQWVKAYLVSRYGVLPDALRINCSGDELWPVLVSFSNAQTGRRHNLQFDCGGPTSAFALLSEKEEK